MLAGRLAGQDPVSQPVPADKGSLSESGKFQSKEAPAAGIPDPAARLAELGVRAEDDRLMIGMVELDRKARTVSFPAKVHAVEGPIEYLLVHSTGKVHETLFVTEATPQDIHIACLLAGWGDVQGKEPAGVLIEASWATNGPQRQESVEHFVAFAKGHPHGKAGGHLETGPWAYAGSMLDAGGFVATREGSIIALIADPAALVTNPRPGREDDSLHIPNRELLPPMGTPVRISVRAAPAEKPGDPRPPVPEDREDS